MRYFFVVQLNAYDIKYKKNTIKNSAINARKFLWMGSVYMINAEEISRSYVLAIYIVMWKIKKQNNIILKSQHQEKILPLNHLHFPTCPHAEARQVFWSHCLLSPNSSICAYLVCVWANYLLPGMLVHTLGKQMVSHGTLYALPIYWDGKISYHIYHKNISCSHWDFCLSEHESHDF